MLAHQSNATTPLYFKTVAFFRSKLLTFPFPRKVSQKRMNKFGHDSVRTLFYIRAQNTYCRKTQENGKHTSRSPSQINIVAGHPIQLTIISCGPTTPPQTPYMITSASQNGETRCWGAHVGPFFGDDDSEGDSDYESSPTVDSVGSDGVSLFGELSVDSDNCKDMYDQSGRQDDNETNDDAHSSGGNPVDNIAIPAVSQHKNNADVLSLKIAPAQQQPSPVHQM